MDKGPVFYKAYYPDTHDTRQEKRYFGRNTVLETSFQVPLERFAYSAETADHPISINESFVVVNNNKTLPKEQWKAIVSQPHNHDVITSQLVSFPDERSTIFDDDKNSQVANIEEISKFVRRVISRDLENWDALEGYLEHTIHRGRSIPQLGMHSREIHKNKEGNSYVYSVNRELKDSSKRSPKKLDAHDGKQRPIYFERVDVNGSTMMNEMRVSGMQAVDTPSPIDVISDSLPPENIFRPRPQLIKYMFFKRPVPPRFDKQSEKAIDKFTPRTFDDNFNREEITDHNRGRRVEENVKVTSIEISELPRHKTRHHHDKWPKRDYSTHRHRSRPFSYPTIS